MNWDIILFSISIIISSIVLFFNCKLTKRYNNLVSGQLALQLRENISSVRRRYEDLSLQCFPDNDEIIQHIVDSNTEDLCNAYDLACSLYISGSLNKENFKQQYFNEIKNIIEDDNFKDKYEPYTTEYQSTKTVYEKWFKPKK